MDDSGFTVSNDDLVREGIDATHDMGLQLLFERNPELFRNITPATTPPEESSSER